MNPRRILRYAAAGFAALALVYGVRAWDGASNDVTLRYDGAPAGELEVVLRDADGARLRQATFGAGAERAHVVQLPRGTFEATLRVGEEAPVRRSFAVEGDAAVEVRY